MNLLVLGFFESLPAEAWLLLITGLIAGIQKLLEWSAAVRRKAREAEHEREGGGVDLAEYERDRRVGTSTSTAPVPPPPPAPAPTKTRDAVPPPPPFTIPGGWMPGEPPVEEQQPAPTPPAPTQTQRPQLPSKRSPVGLPARKTITLRPVLPPRPAPGTRPGRMPHAQHKPPATAHRHTRGNRWTRELSRSKSRQRQAIVLQEIFGAPLALRRAKGRNPRRT